MSKKVEITSRPWTSTEESFVRKNLSKLTVHEIAYELKRTYNSVTWKKRQIKSRVKNIKKLSKSIRGEYQDYPLNNNQMTKPNTTIWAKVKRFFS